ncbi:MAG: DEAD/DEAH box helicase family protein [Methylovulum sp.]|nr:DEAD/DEAH box helicase family protein [Methylovulum sp.]
MITLRPYQARALEDLDAWFSSNETGHPIVSACVGAGKSILIAEFCRRAVLGYPDYRARILMLVPSKELLTQNFDKLAPS